MYSNELNAEAMGVLNVLPSFAIGVLKAKLNRVAKRLEEGIPVRVLNRDVVFTVEILEPEGESKTYGCNEIAQDLEEFMADGDFEWEGRRY